MRASHCWQLATNLFDKGNGRARWTPLIITYVGSDCCRMRNLCPFGTREICQVARHLGPHVLQEWLIRKTCEKTQQTNWRTASICKSSATQNHSFGSGSCIRKPLARARGVQTAGYGSPSEVGLFHALAYENKYLTSVFPALVDFELEVMKLDDFVT